MKSTRLFSLLALVALAIFSVTPARGGNKEAELQAQIQQLFNMQQQIDEKLGGLQARIDQMVQQTTANLNHLNTTIEKLDKTAAQQTAASDSCVDQVVGPAQSLQDSIADLKANLNAISKQLNEMNGVRSSAQAASPQTQNAGAANNPR